MNNSQNQNKKNSKKTNNKVTEKEVEVLYQKLAGTWFAFSMIDDEVYVAPVSDDKINEIRAEKSSTNNNSRNDFYDEAV